MKTSLNLLDTDVAKRHLLAGWSGPEANHRWTNGPEASIKFGRADFSARTVVFRVYCEPYLANGALKHQSITVSLDRVELGRWTVARLGWQELRFDPRTTAGDDVIVVLKISNPVCPAELGISKDVRSLGLSVKKIEISSVLEAEFDLADPRNEWIGQGADPIGDVFKRDGHFYRAIKKNSIPFVKDLMDRGIYRELAARKLIPEHVFRDIDNDQYPMLAHTRAGIFVYPANFSLLTLKDAALTWLDICEFLLSVNENYGLIDGHYGNFALFDNSVPMWIDIGSIADARTGRGDPVFGLNQFIQCYVYPLLMFSVETKGTTRIRQLMHRQPGGITAEQFQEHFGSPSGLEGLVPIAANGERAVAMRKARELIQGLSFESVSGFWSDYRNAHALQHSFQGLLLRPDQDARYRAVIDLALRSKAKSFVDIGANDGLFSLMCVRAGLSGVAVDLDDSALNKLCTFISHHEDIELAVAHGSFLYVNYPSDLALGLAISHHLYLSQGLSFDAISDTLAKNAVHAVITEFMPNGLGGTPGHPQPSPYPLPSDYNIESFLTSLRRRFTSVEVVDYPRPNPTSIRVLIYCENPK